MNISQCKTKRDTIVVQVFQAHPPIYKLEKDVDAQYTDTTVKIVSTLWYLATNARKLRPRLCFDNILHL